MQSMDLLDPPYILRALLVLLARSIVQFSIKLYTYRRARDGLVCQ